MHKICKLKQYNNNRYTKLFILAKKESSFSVPILSEKKVQTFMTEKYWQIKINNFHN